MSRPFTTLLPPPIEAMAVEYFTPLMGSTPVGTRLPNPADSRDTIDGFLRIESGGGSLMGELFFWDMAIILHSYSPIEPQAETIIGKALAWGSNGTGITMTVDSTDWYITYAHATGLPARQADPRVNLTRYRAMVNWRIPGQPLV